MKPYKFLWIGSGLGLLFLWPCAAFAIPFAFDEASISAYAWFIRALLAISLLTTPIIWIAGLTLSIVEVRRMNRERHLRRYALAPYIAAGVHLLAWIVVVTHLLASIVLTIWDIIAALVRFG